MHRIVVLAFVVALYYYYYTLNRNGTLSHLPSVWWLLPFSLFSLPHHPLPFSCISLLFTLPNNRKMSIDIGASNARNTVIVIALLFVPIIVLIFCVCLAIYCSEFWSGARHDRYCYRPCTRSRGKKRQLSCTDQSISPSHRRSRSSASATDFSRADNSLQLSVTGKGAEQV